MEKAAIKVKVKWGKQDYVLEVEPSTEKVIDLKCKLLSLTSIPVDKQKVILKGTALAKDDALLSEYKIVENVALLLMGTAEENASLTQAPPPEKKFIEELSNEERARITKEKTGEALPVGLKNLGNTCYLNSSLQCLRRMNEFKESVIQFKKSGRGDPQEELANNLRTVFSQLENKGDTVTPTMFLMSLFDLFPQFAEKDSTGRAFKQQDADECFQNLLQAISGYLNYTNPEGEKIPLIDYLFQIEFEATMKNTEAPEEPAVTSSERNIKLPCIIDNQANPINQLPEGIQAGLEEKIEKHSPSLGRNAIYEKKSLIKRLPPYLIVHKVRFFWKEAQQAAGTKATKTKILRNVGYPRVLDMYPYATAELKKTLDMGRDYEKKKNEETVKENEGKFEKYKKKLEESGAMVTEDSRELFKKFKEEQHEEDIKSHDEQLYRKHGFGLETGNYELVGVLTHKGRTADSGHYVAWCHRRGDEWIKYDDDEISSVKTEDVLNLRGGGDWHIAYYLIYRKIELA